MAVLDDRQVEVEQRVQRPPHRDRVAEVARPVRVQRPEQAAPQPGQGDVGVDLVEPDLDVPPADPPPPGHVVAVVRPRQQFPQPDDQRPLEAGDLPGAAGDDLAGVRVAVDLGVEVVDQRGEVRLEQGRHRPDVGGVLVGPADVALEVLVAPELFVRGHGGSQPAGPGRCRRRG
jgi:hypothetical protein